MMVTFFTCFQDQETELIDDRGKIAKTYLTGWFFIDFLSVFPFDKMVSEGGDYGGLVRVLRISKIYKIVKVARLVRLFKVFKQR